MENNSQAKEFIINEWDWEQDELDFIGGLNDAQCIALVSNMKKASRYTSMFTISKYSIFTLFIAVYALRYFQLNSLSLIIQMMIIPVGIVAIFSFIMLRKVESNGDYRELFLS